MKSFWTTEKIKEGFDRFIKENGRLPKSIEIDELEYLPSRKLIERNFGGLEKLRGELGEVFVHTEKIFDNTKNRVDFYIYSPSGNFGIDVFGTDTMHNLQKKKKFQN